MLAERSEAMKDSIHGKRGRVGGRSGCGTEVTAPAVGESDTRTDGRPHCHTLRAENLDRLRLVGYTANLQGFTATFGATTEANR